MTDRTRLPLPSPMDYCYEWDGLYGTRKFSAALHNGAPPSRSVPIYTADQMRQYADAECAALRAELAKHQESEFHPDWSMLSATREGLAEHQDMIQRLSEQVRVLREVVESAAAADEFLENPEAIFRLARMARKALGGTK